ncbi:hypothetical protein Bca4012_059314 [Brassica carinata]
MVGAWEWEKATAGAVAGFATVAAMHPLDVVRTIDSKEKEIKLIETTTVNEGRGLSALPTYNKQHSSRSLHQCPSRDAFRAIMKEEGPRALALQGFLMVLFSSQHIRNSPKSLWISMRREEIPNPQLIIYWYNRLLEHDYSKDLVPTESQDRYIDSLHVIRETARFEGLRGFYRGLTANLLKNVPASSITFIVYETVLKHPPTR